MTEDDALETFGFPPELSKGDKIREALSDAVLRERATGGETLLLRALCAQLFFFHHPLDTLLIWSAKEASMDAAASIDVQLLCPTGLETTREHLQQSPHPHAISALRRVEECVAAGDFDDFDIESYRSVLEEYYGGTSSTPRPAPR